MYAVYCLLPGQLLFSLGRKEEEKPLINNEWVLCITDFDYSRLPPARRITGDVLVRNLVEKMLSVSYRFRISPEYAYYESYAWQKSMNAAASSISGKQNERALLLYRGEAGWRYRRNLKRADDEIAKLMENYAKIEAEKPLVNNEPEFVFSQANLSGTYPAVPKSGTEYRFCQNQKADAFLAGEIWEYHSRYYIRLRLYALYTNSYIYEDDIIFSLDDSGGAVEEIAARLTAVLSGSRPAAVMVTADPPESQVLINRNYAGRGTVEAREHPPGNIIIAVSAEGYAPMTVETELAAGELAEVQVNLSPLVYADLNISAAADVPVSVYQGALYVGEAPLTLRLPIESLGYVVAETKGGEEAKVVFIMPDMPDKSFDLTLKTKMPVPSEQRRVSRARSRAYWAWGGTWVAGIAAWVTNGIYTSQNAAMPHSSSEQFYENTQLMYNISIGALIAFGAAAVYDLVMMSRYVYTAASGAAPIARQERAAK